MLLAVSTTAEGGPDEKQSTEEKDATEHGDGKMSI